MNLKCFSEKRDTIQNMYLCPNTFYALEYKTESAHKAFYCTHEFHTHKRCRRCDIYKHLFREGGG